MVTGARAIAPDLRAVLLVCGLCAAVAPGCSRPTASAQTAARAFVDRFFVELDQHAALLLTEGVARAKVEREIALLNDEPPSRNDERPRVYYRQLSAARQDDGMAFYFRLTVVVIGDAPVEPEVMVRVRETNGEWRVSNYEVLPPRDATPVT